MSDTNVSPNRMPADSGPRPGGSADRDASDEQASRSEGPTSGRADPPRRSLGVMTGVVLMVFAGFVLVDLLVQNSQHARLRFLGWTADLTLSALVFATAFVAVLLDQLVGLIWRHRRRHLLNLEEGRIPPRRTRR